MAQEEKLDSYSGYIEDSGEGRWTLQAAIEEAVPAEVLSAALYTRFRSRQQHTYAEKIISAMRKGFRRPRRAEEGVSLAAVMADLSRPCPRRDAKCRRERSKRAICADVDARDKRA